MTYVTPLYRIAFNCSLLFQIADKDFQLSQLNLRLEDTEKQLSDIEAKYKCEILKLRTQNVDLSQSLENMTNNKDKNISHGQSHGTPFKYHNQPPSINGDFLSEAGSMVIYSIIQYK